MAQYIKELRVLLGRTFRERELLGLEETASLCARSKSERRAPLGKITLPFGEAGVEELQRLCSKLADVAPGNVWLVSEMSVICGLPHAVSLTDVNWAFPIGGIQGDVLVFLTDDLKDKLLVDHREEGGKYVFEVEASGRRWGSLLDGAT